MYTHFVEQNIIGLRANLKVRGVYLSQIILKKPNQLLHQEI